MIMHHRMVLLASCLLALVGQAAESATAIERQSIESDQQAVSLEVSDWLTIATVDQPATQPSEGKVGPTPPLPDVTTILPAATQSSLATAIDQAAVGKVTKIILPNGATIPFNSEWSVKDITNKILIIEFPDGTKIDYKVDTSFSFKATHSGLYSIAALGTNGDKTTAKFHKLPPGIAAGKWVKVISDNKIPNDRSNARRMGEAMQVESVDTEDKAVTFAGLMFQQQLYTTGIKGTLYNGGTLWLIHPEFVGSRGFSATQVLLIGLIDSRIVRPKHRTTSGSFIDVVDSVNTYIWEPDMADGLAHSIPGLPFRTYGVRDTSSKYTTVEGTGTLVNARTHRHMINGTTVNPNPTTDPTYYGPSLFLTARNLVMDDMGAASIGNHPGAWGTVHEDIVIRHNGEKAVTCRGRYHTYRNLQVSRTRSAFQFFNEGHRWVGDGRKDCYDIRVEGGKFDIDGPGFYTSGGYPYRNSFPHIVDEIHFSGTEWTSRTTRSGWRGTFGYLDHARGHWTFTDDIVRIEGKAHRVLQIIGPGTDVDIDNMTIDLTGFDGPSIKLFDVDAGSRVDGTVCLINPADKEVIRESGAGTVNVSYRCDRAHDH